MPRLRRPECSCDNETHRPYLSGYETRYAKQDIVALRGMALLPSQEATLDSIAALFFGTDPHRLMPEKLRQLCMLTQEYLDRPVRREDRAIVPDSELAP